MEEQTMRTQSVQRAPVYVKNRNIFLAVLFSICTLGIYYIYWTICLTNDTNRLSQYKTANGLWLYPFSLFTLGIYYFYWAYMLGKKAGDIDGDSSSGAVYLLLCFFGLGIIAQILAQGALNRAAQCYKEGR